MFQHKISLKFQCSKGALLTLAVIVLFPLASWATQQHEMYTAANSAKLIRKREVSVVRVYCMRWERGEHVIVLQGSVSQAYASAMRQNGKRQETINVWCE